MARSLVRQNHPNGCQVAVAAMILGVSYDEAFALYEFEDPKAIDKGLSSPWLEVLLYDLGYSLRILRKQRRMRMSGWAKNEREQWPPEPWTDLQWCEVEPYENAPIGHCVLMLRDGTVLDPAADQPKRLSDYPSVHTVIGVEPPFAAAATNAERNAA
jgi:hypothetical protein